MTSSRLRLLLGGVAVFLITLILHLPADRVLNLYRDRLPGNIGWQQLTGNIFNPSFSRLVINMSDRQSMLIESADIRISVLPLLVGRLKFRFTVKVDDGQVSGVAVLRRNSWQVPMIEGQVPLRAITAVLPAAGMAAGSGQVNISGNQLAGPYQKLPIAGMMDIVVNQLQLDLLHPQPIGDYALKLQADEETGVNGRIDTLTSDALINVQAELKLDAVSNSLRIDGQARVASNAPDAVTSVLPLLGTVTDGIARIQWQTGL
jgi:hypothetical protein